MKIRLNIHVSLILLFAGPVFSDDRQDTWVDLTYPLSGTSIFWPTAAPFELKTDAEGVTEAGYYYSAYTFSTSEHGGTHIDAPIHFAEGRMTVDQIPLSTLIGSAVVIDVSTKALKNPDYLVTVADLTSWEQVNGRIPNESIVLIRTGYGRYWPDAQDYLGTKMRGQAGVDALHFPGLHPDAATWFVKERIVKAIGIDTASIDFGQSKQYRSHVTLMSANIPAFENVANMNLLPATGAFVVALPIKIEGGSGGPLRIVARLQK
jgi:kynurenine formamidase